MQCQHDEDDLQIWDPGIKESIHDGMTQRHDVTQWFIWDPGIHMQLTGVDCLRARNLRAEGLVMSPFINKLIIN